VCAFIITAGDSFKSFLTSGIPNLKLNRLSIDIYGSNFEIDTDGGHEVVVENIVLRHANIG